MQIVEIQLMASVCDSGNTKFEHSTCVFCAVRILQTLCRKLKLPNDFDYKQLARLTPGYVGADLMALCREAAMTAVNRVLLETSGLTESHGQISVNEPLRDGVHTEADVTDEEAREQQTADINAAPQQEPGQNHLQV